MNLNEQRCSVCNTKSDELTILQDGVLCQACRQLLSCFSTELAGRSIADVQDQLGRREANRQRVATFSPSRLVGPGDCLHIDDKHETFLFGFGRDFRDGNPPTCSRSTNCATSSSLHAPKRATGAQQVSTSPSTSATPTCTP